MLDPLLAGFYAFLQSKFNFFSNSEEGKLIYGIKNPKNIKKQLVFRVNCSYILKARVFTYTSKLSTDSTMSLKTIAGYRIWFHK